MTTFTDSQSVFAEQARASAPAAAPARRAFESAFRHRLRLGLAITAACAAICGLAWFGFDYYRLPLTARMRSPLHPLLRPSGIAGIRIGITGALLCLCLYSYGVRKRWKWLGRLGNTRHWLDFHILAGVAAPILVTFHCGFKFRGLAGVAYWIMIAVMLSGFVGRYLYAQIPRSLGSAELTLSEVESLRASIEKELAAQPAFPGSAGRLSRAPSREQMQSMSIVSVFWTMLRFDLARPFLAAALRRERMSRQAAILSLGGLISSHDPETERLVRLARRQAWLISKIAVLDRAREIFHLWHVIHRPFSYSLAVLVAAHVLVVVLLGYY
jgi:hypothetical protein